MPNVGLAFTTLGLGLAELAVLSAFAWTLTVVEVVVGGDGGGTLQGVVAGLGFAKLVLVPDAFAVVLVSTPLSSDESSPKGTLASKPRPS